MNDQRSRSNRLASRTDSQQDTVWVDPILDQLFPNLAPPGVRWGLHKTRALLARVGRPHDQFDVIHVGGTNGKGSVSALLAAVLRRSGHRVGLYTSPHLVRFAERIQVDGAPVAEDKLLEFARDLHEAFVADEATFFEATTALAFHTFAQLDVDIAVVEVGLGGRLDSTNVVAPLVTAITNIGLDHAHYLGDTLVEIAGEKAGIIKPGVPVVTGVTEPEILEVIAATADERGAPCLTVSWDDLASWSTDAEHTTIEMDTRRWGEIEAEFGLAGSHQALNAAVAVRVLEELPEKFRPSKSAVVEGLAAAHWPGRFERRLVNGRHWLFDVAHNLPGVEALIASAESVGLGRPWVAVMGILNDKDWAPMTARIAAAVDHLILTVPPSFPESRRWDVGAVADHVRASVPQEWAQFVEVVDDLPGALSRASDLARRSSDSTVLITGSCHTVGDAFLSLGIEPFSERATED